MSDLISRSKLIEEIDELLKSPYANQLQFGAERREAIETVRDLCVKKQHTAYDIDKVVSELEKKAGGSFSIYRDAIIDAIEIVKHGGVTDDMHINIIKKEVSVMEFLSNLDAETVKAELLTFIDCNDIEVKSKNDFVEQFIDFIKEDLTYGD